MHSLIPTLAGICVGPARLGKAKMEEIIDISVFYFYHFIVGVCKDVEL